MIEQIVKYLVNRSFLGCDTGVPFLNKHYCESENRIFYLKILFAELFLWHFLCTNGGFEETKHTTKKRITLIERTWPEILVCKILYYSVQ